jgi:hypothetical protein
MVLSPYLVSSDARRLFPVGDRSLRPEEHR